MVGGQEVRNTDGRLASRRITGSRNRNVDADLLALVMSGYALEQIVEMLDLRLDDIYQRLLELRGFIEDASRFSSSY